MSPACVVEWNQTSIYPLVNLRASRPALRVYHHGHGLIIAAKGLLIHDPVQELSSTDANRPADSEARDFLCPDGLVS